MVATARIAPRQEHESSFRKWATLMVLSLALAIIIIDSTLLNVALSTLIRDLNTSLQKLQWVISAYSLMLAALTVTGGRMGDLFGRKRMFKLGAVVFVAGAVTASLAHSFFTLLLGESIIEGIGAALMMPATASLLVAKYHGHDRAVAFGIWGGVAAAASAIGPILGGFLTTHYSWRWGFRINVVVCAILLVGSRLVEDNRPPEKSRIDWVGVLLSSTGLFGIVFAIIESEKRQMRMIAIAAFAIGAVIVALFSLWEWRYEKRGGQPTLSMRLFQNREFVAGAGVVGVMMLAQNGVIFSLPVYLQSVRDLDALHTGLTLLPMSVMLLIVSPLAAKLTRTFNHKRLVQTGLVVNIVAILILRFTITPVVNLLWLWPGLALYGIGMGLVLSQINNLTLSAIPVKQAGEGSGVVNTYRQIGISLGIAIIGAVLISTILTGLDTSVAQSRAIPQQSKSAITAMLGANAADLAFGERRMFDRFAPAVQQQLNGMRRTSTTVAIRRAFVWCAIFAALCLGVSMLLPLRPATSK